MEIFDGIPHAPYFIFIKGLVEKKYEEILEFFDLCQIQQISMNEGEDFHDELYDYYIYLFKDEEWVHIMDNWNYTLRYSRKFTKKINELGQRYEIFTCLIGEMDESFEFEYYNDGQKLREYVVDSPNYNDEVISINFGTPLKGEPEALQKSYQLDRVIYIATTLGIELPKEVNEISCFVFKD